MIGLIEGNLICSKMCSKMCSKTRSKIRENVENYLYFDFLIVCPHVYQNKLLLMCGLTINKFLELN